MSLVVPSETCLHFWSLDHSRNLILLGSPNDSVRNFKIFEKADLLTNGIQLYFVLAELKEKDPFPSWFYKEVSKLKYKSIHLGGKGQDYLLQIINLKEKLKWFSMILEKLEIQNIIIHAQHFKKRRQYLREMFLEYLPNAKILIENEGLTDKWASSIEGLTELFTDCPEFRCCLDICHVIEINDYNLDDIISVDVIKNRIDEISISYCPKNLNYDPYDKVGFPGYKPNHALFSVVKESISSRTKNFISRYPVVMEGVIPTEDKKLQFIKKEMDLLSR